MSKSTDFCMPFKHKRVGYFIKLKGLSIADIEKDMSETLGRKVNGTIQKWIADEKGGQSMEVITAFCIAIALPIEAMYFRIKVSMDNDIVSVYLSQSNETIIFQLFNPQP